MYPLPFLLLASYVAATSLPRQTIEGTAVVNLSNNTGTPAHLASGFLYGIPNTLNQIPDKFFTEIGFNYGRAGGAQNPAPARGWIWGLTEYKNRFAAALSSYKTARKYNANFIFLIHDLWGADGSQNATAPYPGDNGDWTSWDDYLTQWISDMNANDATVALSIDIWNEPDLTIFWNRTQAQYLQMWGRTFHRLRTEWPDVLLIGPAAAEEPATSSAWWTAFASFIATNASIPDQYVWHMESGGGDMLSAQAGLQAVLKEFGLPLKPLNIDEYAILAEQVPAGSAWWISQFERVNAHALRGNWQSGLELSDLMANLISKPTAGTTSYNPTGTGYFPVGDWQVYKYYFQNMTGFRVGTLPSADLKLDAYATVGDLVRVLVGVRITEGTWQVTINDLSAVGLPETGTLDIHTWGFRVAANEHFGEVDAPQDLGFVEHTYSGNSVTFPIFQVDTTSAFAFEFSLG